MARATGFRTSADVAQLRKRSRKLLVKLRQDIRTAENQLASLKKEGAMLANLTGVRTTMASRRPVGSRPGRKSRIDWTKVLEQMPSQFKAGDVRKVRGLQNKRATEIFAAITRWIDSGSVKRKKRGVYERAQPRKTGAVLTMNL